MYVKNLQEKTNFAILLSTRGKVQEKYLLIFIAFNNICLKISILITQKTPTNID